MIKINLLKNLGLDQGGGLGTGMDDLPASVQRDAGLRLLLILSLPLALMAYEKVNLSAIHTEIQQLEETRQAIEKEAASFGDAAPIVEKYTKEKQAIDSHFNVIVGLAKLRLREVKALDILQSSLPSHVWLKRIAFTGNVVTITGYSTAEQGVSELIKALEQRSVFSKVEPKSTNEEVLSTGRVKAFEVAFQVGI